MRYALSGILLITALVWGTWLIVIPADMIEQRMEDSLRQGEMRAEFSGLRKGLFYSLKAEVLDIRRGGEVLVSVYDLKVRPDWAQFLGLRAGVRFRGELGGGSISGKASTGSGGERLEARARDVRLEQMDLYALTGQRISGQAEADLEMKGREGEVTMSARGLVADQVEVRGFSLPRDIFHTARGAASIKAGTVNLTSLTLEGEGFFARLSGVIGQRRTKLTLELMPEDQEKELLISAALSRFRVSKGYYRVPLKKAF
jgi:type II secretion system protein N